MLAENQRCRACGVVDQNVDAAQHIADMLEDRRDMVTVAQISRENVGGATDRGNAVGGLGQLLARAGDHPDGGTGCREVVRDRPADAATRTGNQRGAAGERVTHG